MALALEPVTALVRDLTDDFANDPNGPNVQRILAEYTAKHDDWRRFSLFKEKGYARNLVAHTDAFDLLVLSWNANNESPIHNHAGQNCWMGVLEGSIEEVLFETPGEFAEPGPLTQIALNTYTPGGVAYIHDDIALHIIRPGGGKPGISLHLYAKPFYECNIYCPKTGRIERRPLGYYSIDGVVQDDEMAWCK